jgi:hypothetical protein
MGNLQGRVANYYELCLSVNSSWCNFTNELVLLATFDLLEQDNYAFVVDLIAEEFEGEDIEEIDDAVSSFLSTRRISLDHISAGLMGQAFRETGYLPDDFADAAVRAGVSRAVIEEFLQEYPLENGDTEDFIREHFHD